MTGLSPALDTLIRQALRDAPARFAGAVRGLSDFYTTKTGRPTPWDDPATRAAYLAYFLPLNYIRLLSVGREIWAADLAPLVESIWDFGSGLGTLQWVLEDLPELTPRPLYAFERAPAAIAIHRELIALRGGCWTPEFNSPTPPGPGALGLFSYAYLEMRPPLQDLTRFDHLVILEPSTREAGRALMALRGQLMEEGYHALAPCTHQAACPLLTRSPRDWCHHRVFFDPPAWWAELEAELPMKNRSLTYSYLVMSRAHKNVSPPGAARVIGDTLYENGKTRQLICRGPEREFLSWLKRDGEPEALARGAVLADLGPRVARKGDELRVAKGQSLGLIR